MIAGQILIVQFGGIVFQTESLDMIQWSMCIGLGLLSIPVGIIIRLIPTGLISKFLVKLF